MGGCKIGTKKNDPSRNRAFCVPVAPGLCMALGFDEKENKVTKQAWYYGILIARYKRTGLVMFGEEIGNWARLGNYKMFIDYLSRWVN